MNTPVKILLSIVCGLLVAIGALCYNLNVFDRFILFLLPVALIRLAFAIQLINLQQWITKRRP